MFAVPQFCRRTKILRLSTYAAIKDRLLSSRFRHRSKSSDRQRLPPSDSPDNDSQPYVETNVLGSIQGYLLCFGFPFSVPRGWLALIRKPRNDKFLATHALDSVITVREP